MYIDKSMSDDRIRNIPTRPPTPPTARIAAAQDYAQRGWSIFPAEIAGKAPFMDLLPAKNPSKPKRNTNPASNPSTFLPFCSNHADAAQVHRWWTTEPEANIALLMGPSQLLVIDVDLHKIQPERREALLAQMAPTPYVVETPSGGLHLYYRHPPEPLRVVSQKVHKYSEVIDVQSGNLYVIAPPSRTRAGSYRWREGTPPWDPELLPPAPAWVISDECDPGAFRVLSDQSSSDWYAVALSFDVPENGDPSLGVLGRKQHVRSMALYGARRGEKIARTIALLQCWNQQRCKPPLRDAEVAKLVHVMYQHHYEDLGIDDSDTVTLRVPSPAFPVDTLRVAGVLWEWARYTSGMVHVNQDLTCFTALVGASIAAAGKYLLEIEGIPPAVWSPPVLLWGVGVAPSGSKKSALIRQVNAALAPTQEVLALIARRYNAEIKARHAVLSCALAEAKKALNHASAERRDQAVQIISAVTLELESLPAELPHVWMLGDTTPEALEQIAARLGWLALVSEEGDDVLGGFFGRYGNGSNFNGLLKMYDRGSTTTARVGRGVSEMRDGMAGLLLMTQSSGLSGLATHEAEDRGLNARILWCIPRVDDAKFLTPPTDDQADRARADKCFAALLRAIYFGGRGRASEAETAARGYRPEYEETPTFDLSELEDEAPPIDGPKPRGRPPKPLVMPASRKLMRPVLRELETLTISLEAQEPADALHAQLKAGAKLGGDYYLASAWAHKGREHAFRIAAVLALADTWGETRVVERQYVEAACELVRDYFLPQVAAAADLMTWPAEAANCVHLLHRFADRDTFSAGDVARELQISTKRAEHLAFWLAERGALSVVKKGRKVTCTRLPNVNY